VHDELRELGSALRKAAPATAWRVGERAAEAGKVALISTDDDSGEYLLAVSMGQGPAHQVYLWPIDSEWECDCESSASACAHAVAALCGLRSGLDALPEAEAAPHIVMQLSRQGRWLDLQLAIRRGESIEPCDASLPSDVLPSEELRRLRRIQSGATGKRVASRHYRALMSALLAADEVTLDSQPVQVSKVPLERVAVVDRVGTGYRLMLLSPESVEEEFEGEPTIALCEGALRPLGNGRLSELQLHQLRQPLIFHPHELPRLTSEWLPALEKAVRVIRRDGVPESQEAGLQAILELQPREGLIEVWARIVYGTPAVAEIRGDELIPLGGVRALPPRDRAGELRLHSQLREELAMRAGQRLRLEASDAARFIRDRLSTFSGRIIGKEHASRFRVHPTTLKPRIEWRDGRLLMSFEGGGQSASTQSVLRAWNDGETLVSLGSEGFIGLPEEWLHEHAHLVAMLIGDESEGSGSHLAPLAAELFESVQEQLPTGLEQLASRLRDEGSIPQLPAPQGLLAELRPYQLRGWSWLRFLGEHSMGAVLADDMGLGKTVQTLAALVADREAGPALVVAPTSVLRNWESEARRFAPDLRLAVLHGPKRQEQLEQLRRGELDVLITSYAILLRDIEALSAISFYTVVIDEAQAIKNADSKTSRAARRLRAHHRIALTGTPIENRLSELWSLMEFLNPGLFGSRKGFTERLAGPASRGNQQALLAIRTRIRPFIMRRLKEDVAADLPARSESLVHCQLSEAQRAGYEAVRHAAIKGLQEPLPEAGKSMGARRMQVLAALTRLRQAACHPGMLPGGSPDAESGKLNRLMELLPRLVESGHKALVFSQWTSLLDLVEPRLTTAGLEFVRLDGSTRDRAAVIEHFQTEGGPAIFLISLKAGGTGLNLTAADHVFHLDPWWNPAVEQQATDRAHRIGQTRPVFSWKLVSEGTVEERIVALQERKRALADSILGGGGVAEGVNITELEELLDPLAARSSSG